MAGDALLGLIAGAGVVASALISRAIRSWLAHHGTTIELREPGGAVTIIHAGPDQARIPEAIARQLGNSPRQ